MATKLTAIKRKDGTYAIEGKTFYIKEKIKSLNGRWNPALKAWIVSPDVVDILGALRMYIVRVAPHCHEPERLIFVEDSDVKRGVHRMGCMLCDTSYRDGEDVPILEVIKEAEEDDQVELFDHDINGNPV